MSKRKIIKYRLRLDDHMQEIAMPEKMKIVHVGDQDGFPTMWVEVEEDHVYQPPVLRRFLVVGTGQPLRGATASEPGAEPYRDDSMWRYLGTAVGAVFVWHVYIT